MNVRNIVRNESWKKKDHILIIVSFNITDRQVNKIFKEYIIIDLMNVLKENSDFYLE